MGDVYRAIDQQDGREVAVKVLRSSADEVERARFQREIAVIADLRHPAIVEYIDHGSLPDGRPFYAMEWLEGEDLSQRQRHDPLGMRDAVEVIRRSSQGMAAVHARGIVHRDLKLGNIFLVRGRGTAVKLIDFGVVRMPGAGHEEDRGSILGTPHFMAPEQARGEDVDARADVYSLGAALFKLVTGRNVFETDHMIALLGRLVIEDPPSPMSIRFDVPDALDRVILQAIARDKRERFESAGELARALARVGELNDDPPATDRSASAVRRSLPELARHVVKRSSSAVPAQASPPLPASAPRPSEPGGPKSVGSSERRVVAALLLDLGASELPAALQEELRKVLGEDVRLEQVLGGRLIAVLGVTKSTGDEAIRAGRAALLVTNASKDVRAVVAVGYAVTQHGGAPGLSGDTLPGQKPRRRSNLAGEALERAAAQIELGERGTARVDASVVSALAGRFVLQEDEHGAVLVREDPQGFGARLLLGRPTRTVGRDKELALLKSVYDELLEEGTPRAAVITGAAGIGKSRLRSELVARLETSGFPPEILMVRGDPMSRGSSLSSFGRAMRAVVGVHDGVPLEQQIARVRAHLDFRLPKSLRFLGSFLSELLGVPFPDVNDEPLRAARQSPQLMQSRTRMALEAFVRAQADLMPQVLVLEDAQWADETTLDLIDWLLSCPDLKFAVYVFARPELDARSLWQQKNVTRLSLPPLSPIAAEKLVRTALPEADARLRGSIVDRAGGNALFLEELVRAAALGRDELPLTVQATVQLRLDGMPKSTREVVRAASVLGPTFWTGAVDALVGRDTRAELAELEEAEIISRQPLSRIAGEAEWTFRQSLVRDTAYASLLDEDRSTLHRATARWLENKGDDDVGLIAKHADAGEDFERAAQLYARATRQAYSGGAHLETALDLAERGLNCGAQGAVKAELLVAATQARIPLGRLEDAVRAAEQAAELSTPGSEIWAEALCMAAVALTEIGRAAEGEDRAARALAPGLVERLEAPTRLKLMAARVRGLVDLGKPREALQLADQALVEARALQSTEVLLRVLDARLFASMQIAEPAEVVANGPSLIDIADSAGDVVLATKSRINTASSMNLLGMWEEARILLDRALGDARDRRMRILEAFALHNLGMCEARLGLVERGLEMQRQAGKIADETGAARLRVHARVYEAVLLLWREQQLRDEGRTNDGAELEAATALASYVEAEVRGLEALRPTGCFLLARVALARHDHARAAAHARRAIELVERTPVEEWEELTHLTLVEAELALGNVDAAHAALDAAFMVVCEHARRVPRLEQRNSYLGRVPEVREIVTLARERLGRSLPFFAALPPLRPPGTRTQPPTGAADTTRPGPRVPNGGGPTGQGGG